MKLVLPVRLAQPICPIEAGTGASTGSVERCLGHSVEDSLGCFQVHDPFKSVVEGWTFSFAVVMNETTHFVHCHYFHNQTNYNNHGRIVNLLLQIVPGQDVPYINVASGFNTYRQSPSTSFC